MCFSGFWSIIVTSDVSHKSLIAVLAYLISNGAKVGARRPKLRKIVKLSPRVKLQTFMKKK